MPTARVPRLADRWPARAAAFAAAVMLFVTAAAAADPSASSCPAAPLLDQTQRQPPLLESPQRPPLPLLNQKQPLARVLTGGFTSVESFPLLAAQGYRTFVDLRSDAEVTPEVCPAAEAAGMRFHRIPVSGEADLDLATARALRAVLQDPAAYPLVIVCGSGNRVGALLAVESFWFDGATGDAALALGQRAGLTKLEPSVRQLLHLPPLPSSTPGAAPPRVVSPPPPPPPSPSPRRSLHARAA